MSNKKQIKIGDSDNQILNEQLKLLESPFSEILTSEKINEFFPLNNAHFNLLNNQKNIKLFSHYSIQPSDMGSLIFLAIVTQNFKFLENNLEKINLGQYFLASHKIVTSLQNPNGVKPDHRYLTAKSLENSWLMMGNILPPRLMNLIAKKLIPEENQLIHIFQNSENYSQEYFFSLINLCKKNKLENIFKKSDFLNYLLPFTPFASTGNQDVYFLKKQRTLLKILSSFGGILNEPIIPKNESPQQKLYNKTTGDFILTHLMSHLTEWVRSNHNIDCLSLIRPVINKLIASNYEIKNPTMDKSAPYEYVKSVSKIIIKNKKISYDSFFILSALVNDDPYFEYIKQHSSMKTAYSLKKLFEEHNQSDFHNFFFDKNGKEIISKVVSFIKINDLFIQHKLLPQKDTFWSLLLKIDPELINYWEKTEGIIPVLKEVLKKIVPKENQGILQIAIERLELRQNVKDVPKAIKLKL